MEDQAKDVTPPSHFRLGEGRKGPRSTLIVPEAMIEYYDEAGQPVFCEPTERFLSDLWKQLAGHLEGLDLDAEKFDINRLLQLLRYRLWNLQGLWNFALSCAHSELRVILDIFEGIMREEDSSLVILPMPEYHRAAPAKTLKTFSPQTIAEGFMLEASRLERELGTNREQFHNVVVPLARGGFRVRTEENSFLVNYGVEQLLTTTPTGKDQILSEMQSSLLRVNGDLNDVKEDLMVLLVNKCPLKVPFPGQNDVEKLALQRQESLLSVKIFQTLKQEALETPSATLSEDGPLSYGIRTIPDDSLAMISLQLREELGDMDLESEAPRNLLLAFLQQKPLVPILFPQLF